MRLLDSDEAEKIKSKMIRGGYLTGRSTEHYGESFSENSVYGEFHFRIPIKVRLLFTQRLRSDFRWQAPENEYTYRLHYRWMIEREFCAKAFAYVPYFSIEPYYDSRFDSISRVRVIGGSSFKWSNWYALEGNITYQYDDNGLSINLYGIAAILHLYFENGQAD